MNLKYAFFFSLYWHVLHVNANNGTCACYIHGTIPTTEGESMCDNKTLQCKCYPNVIGKNCDKCAKGFYYIISGRGCTSCRCDVLGSRSKSCDPLTGQCPCKDDFVGLQCSQCAPQMYKPSSSKCTSCNCNIFGSETLQCDLVGQCSCLLNVEGQHCDHCKENTYSIEKGCIPCSPCYELIQAEVSHFKQYLDTIEIALIELDKSSHTIIQNHKHFINEIKVLKAKIDKLRMLYDEAIESAISEEVLDDLINQAENVHNEILRLIKKFDEEYDYKEIENAWYVGHKNLTEAKEIAKICEEALANATEMSNTANRHNDTMTRIAKQAVAKSQDIEDKAESFHQLSLNVSSTCNDTCATAEIFYHGQKTREDEIKNISSEVSKSLDGLLSIKTYLEGFHNETKDVKQEAIRLQTEESKLEVPSTNLLTEKWAGIEKDLISINITLEDFTEKLEEENLMQSSAKKYLEKVQSKQQDVDDQFVQAQEYDTRADIAIATSTDILENAKKGLNKLKEYEKIKKSAEEAWRDMPDMRKIIDDLLNSSDEVKSIFKELSNTINNIDNIKATVNDLLIKIKDNETMFLNNLKTLEELEQQQKDIRKELEGYHSTLKDIRHKLQRAEKDQEKIEICTQKLEEYKLFLDALPLTEHELLEIEKDIKSLEDTHLEEIINTIKHIKDEKEILEKEVRNLKDILESIPDRNNTLCESPKSEPKATRG